MGAFFYDLTHNSILLAAVTAWAAAQLCKGALMLIRDHRILLVRLLGSGGMPSSHSSTVFALATATAIRCGSGSPEFALAAIVALIVVYDARGVRREAGKHGRMLNELQDRLESINEPLSWQEQFDELVGHSSREVFVGILLGILIGLLFGLYVG